MPKPTDKGNGETGLTVSVDFMVAIVCITASKEIRVDMSVEAHTTSGFGIHLSQTNVWLRQEFNTQ
jgi:hypothetical protein